MDSYEFKCSDVGSFDAVEETIRKVKGAFSPDSRIPEVFRRCIQDTLQKTIRILDDGSVFVLTGDIPAMWLRDSACQLHLFVRFAGREPRLRALIEGLIRKQVECVLLDPYANAFNESANGNCWEKDITDMKDELWERKYEMDSLSYPVQLSYLLWKSSGQTNHFTDSWKEAAWLIIRTFRTEQYHETKSDYRFERPHAIFQDTLSRGGKGALVKEDVGMVFSAFRPSDDACVYGYNIPENMLACVALEYIAEIAREVYRDEELAAEAQSFAQEIRAAVETIGVLPGQSERVWAYETDGYGQYLVMDDANVPSLLAAPYMGYCRADDECYLNTRKMILSEANPYYYKGRCLSGIGSPHTPVGYVWDIALAVEGLTAADKDEKLRLLNLMADNDAGTFQMHEGIDCDDSAKYTRPWFSWANSMFCELVLDVCGL